jgi:hypothetical protein
LAFGLEPNISTVKSLTIFSKTLQEPLPLKKAPKICHFETKKALIFAGLNESWALK